jgi:hypothetical protein
MFLVETIHFCEACGGAIQPDDGTPVRLVIQGRTYQFYFHNRSTSDCLARYIEQTRQVYASHSQFAAAPESNNN